MYWRLLIIPLQYPQYHLQAKVLKLKELSTRSDAQAWFQAGGHLALYILTGSLVFYFWSQHIWIAFLIALFFHGTVASFFIGVAPHEPGHGSVFQTRRLNSAFLYLYSLLSWGDQG